MDEEVTQTETYLECTSANSLNIEIECGDLILFSRRCLSMGFTAGTICLGAKFLNNSTYDHIGIVVEDITHPDKPLYLLEANMSGITKRLLHKRLKATSSSHIAIRKTIYQNQKNDLFKQNLWNLSEKFIGKNYNDSFFTMTNALIYSYIDHSKPLIDRNINDKVINGNTSIPKNSINTNCIRSKFLYSNDSKSLIDLKENFQLSSDVYYCSQLVYEALSKVGVLKLSNDALTNQDFSKYQPADFSSKCFIPRISNLLNDDWFFSPDLIISNPKKSNISTKQKGRVCIQTMHQPFHFSKNDILPPHLVKQLLSHKLIVKDIPKQNYFCPAQINIGSKDLDRSSGYLQIDELKHLSYFETLDKLKLDQIVDLDMKSLENIYLKAEKKMLLDVDCKYEKNIMKCDKFHTNGQHNVFKSISQLPFIVELLSQLRFNDVENANISEIPMYQFTLSENSSIHDVIGDDEIDKYLYFFLHGSLRVESNTDRQQSITVSIPDSKVPRLLNPELLLGIDGNFSYINHNDRTPSSLFLSAPSQGESCIIAIPRYVIIHSSCYCNY